MTEEQIIKNLKKLRGITTLSKEEKEQGRVLFLQKVAEHQAQKVNTHGTEIDKTSLQDRLLTPVKVLAESFVQSRQLAYKVLRVYSSHIYASILITVLVFGAFGVYSGLSARRALPDNKPLYTLKTALEKTQLTLSFTSTSKAEKRFDFLARRVDELDQLVAKTTKYPERNGRAVEVAIKNTQNEISAVIAGLTSVSEKKDAKEINEIKKMVEKNISIYQIALDGVHEDLPENIKNDLGEDVQALSSSISKINNAIDYVVVDQLVEGAADVATSTQDNLDEVFYADDDLAATTITTTRDLLIDLESEVVVPAIPVIVEEPFSIEKDTFKVLIGN
jgi:hypothetical protein